MSGPGARSESRATLVSPYGLLEQVKAVSKQKPDSRNAQKKAEKIDVALIHGRTADGQGLRVIRRRDDRVELADVRPLEQGKPIHGEVVRMTPRSDFPLLCDVETELPAPSASTHSHKGPAQVATDTYRKNWDAIFHPAPDDAVEPDLLN